MPRQGGCGGSNRSAVRSFPPEASSDGSALWALGQAAPAREETWRDGGELQAWHPGLGEEFRQVGARRQQWQLTASLPL